MTGRTRFVEDIDFLRAAFDFGLSVNDGIKELVDNSLDNNATSIRFQIIKREDGGIRLVVAVTVTGSHSSSRTRGGGKGSHTSWPSVEGVSKLIAGRDERESEPSAMDSPRQSPA